ncbi:MAG: hypothetical protein WCJ19_01235, partial [bacterium]
MTFGDTFLLRERYQKKKKVLNKQTNYSEILDPSFRWDDNKEKTTRKRQQGKDNKGKTTRERQQGKDNKGRATREGQQGKGNKGMSSPHILRQVFYVFNRRC